MEYRTGDQAQMRELNLSSVLNYLKDEAPLSRARLATLTGLNKATVSSLIEELLEDRLVYEVGIAISGTGRPATLLEINPKAGMIVGLELTSDTITCLLSDFTGQVLWRQKQMNQAGATQGETIQNALCMVDAALAFGRQFDYPVLGIGITLTGLIDLQEGILVFSPSLQWSDVPLVQLFHDHTSLNVYLDNDANAAALGEHYFGAAKNIHNFLFVTLGKGVGAGLFLNGNLYRGMDGYAGEIGHTTLIADPNYPCRCGSKGCWETSVNEYSVVERIRARIGIGRPSLITKLRAEQNTPLNFSIIQQAANAGDAETLEVLSEVGRSIGVGLSNLINIFNPEMIILGGSMSAAGNYLLPGIEAAIAQRPLSKIVRRSKVIISDFGQDASIMGAVAMVAQAIISHPSIVLKQKQKHPNLTAPASAKRPTEEV